MATNLALDDRVVNKAVKVGGHKSKREAVMAALEEYVRKRARLRIFELEGQIDYDPRYDHKAARRRKH
jgi:Arc/MetJ family transcription regulator